MTFKIPNCSTITTVPKSIHLSSILLGVENQHYSVMEKVQISLRDFPSLNEATTLMAVNVELIFDVIKL